ncbi:ABC transporter [Cyclobacterium lianum]|uniref:ABC transporter n=1 Tax=Cyclobacterium lianum TaxID=388280 RepID=A0A1M7JTY9_9BACT|nr:ATP-binding cassette domain-containing protein [Cyclobacterium lianum]SHM56007.1 ABC transporter [Cyclobacterium lianum]
MLSTQSIIFEYNQANHFAFPDISLSAGSDLLILGESGVGKTTLLHLIPGLLKPKTGKITIEETAITDLKGKLKLNALDYYQLNYTLENTWVYL